MYLCVSCVQFEALQLYRRQTVLRDQKKVDPSTGKIYAKKGMAQCCRQIEAERGLEPMSISKSTLNRWQRLGVMAGDDVRNGRAPVLPIHVEENLIKLVLACDARGDAKASPAVVRRAVGLYIQGTAFEKEFRERYPGRWKEDKGVIVPGKVWMKNWYKRIKQMPEYKKIIKCRGRGVDIDKLRCVSYMLRL